MPRNLFEYHPVTGYRYIPGLEARVRHEGGGYLVQCNRLGFRCRHEVTEQRPPSTFRILLFGDSYTAGDGVSNAFRFGDLLEARLGPDVQVLNFGLPGSGTDQQYLCFREFTARIEYDLLLLCPMVENIVRNGDRFRLSHSAFTGRLVERAKPYFELEGDRLVLRHCPVPKRPAAAELDAPTEARSDHGVRALLRRATAGIDRRLPGFRAATQRLRRIALPHEYNDPGDPAWLLLRAILASWLRESRSRVVLAPLPTFAHVDGGIDPRPYLRRFRELAAATGAELVDVLPRLRREPRAVRARCRFPIDEHPTRLCHRLYAEALAPAVEARVRASCDAR